MQTGIPRDIADLLGDGFGAPPHAVAEGGFQQVVRHYEALAHSGEAILNRLKVVMVGAARAGKTNLVRSLREGAPRLTADWDRTIGVDIGRPWNLGAIEEKLELVFWDFGGHTDYHPTHRLFYTKWALYLLVIDLHKFQSDVGCRVDMVDSWLDALLAIVPGSPFLVVLTHTDLFGSSPQVTEAVKTVEGYLLAYLEDRRREYKRSMWKRKETAGTGSIGADVDQGPALVICGIKTISCSNPQDLEALQAEIVRVSTSERDHSLERLFPHVGQRVAKVWARASAVMDALRNGTDLLDSAGLGDAYVDARKGQKQLRFPAQSCARLTEISSRWNDVVQTLALQPEVGEEDSTVQASGHVVLSGFFEGSCSACEKFCSLLEGAARELIRSVNVCLDGGSLPYPMSPTLPQRNRQS